MSTKELSVFCPPVDKWPNRIEGVNELTVVDVLVQRGQFVEHGQELIRVCQKQDSSPWPLRLVGYSGVVQQIFVASGDVLTLENPLLRILTDEFSLRQISTMHSWLDGASSWASQIQSIARKESKLRRDLGLGQFEVIPDSYFSQDEIQAIRSFSQHTHWFLNRYLVPAREYASKDPRLNGFSLSDRDELLSELAMQITRDWNRGAVLLAWERARGDQLPDGSARSFRMFYRARIRFMLQTAIKEFLRVRNKHVDFQEQDIIDPREINDDSRSSTEGDFLLELLKECFSQVESWIKMTMKSGGEKAALRTWRWMELSKSELAVSEQVEVMISEGLYETFQAADRDRRRRLDAVIKIVARNLDFIPMPARNDDIIGVMSTAVYYVLDSCGYKSISLKMIRSALDDDYGAEAVIG